MAVNNGRSGFWVKTKATGTNPGGFRFVTVDNPSQIQQQKSFYQTLGDVEWVGENQGDYAATSGTQQFVGARPDAVADTYFDEILREIETGAQTARQRADQSREVFVRQLKQGRELFDADLGRTYAKSLQQINERAYARGLGNSGIKQEDFYGATTEKDTASKTRDVYDAQRQELKNMDYQNTLADIARSEESSKRSLDRNTARPYAQFSYL